MQPTPSHCVPPEPNNADPATSGPDHPGLASTNSQVTRGKPPLFSAQRVGTLGTVVTGFLITAALCWAISPILISISMFVEPQLGSQAAPNIWGICLWAWATWLVSRISAELLDNKAALLSLPGAVIALLAWLLLQPQYKIIKTLQHDPTDLLKERSGWIVIALLLFAISPIWVWLGANILRTSRSSTSRQLLWSLVILVLASIAVSLDHNAGSSYAMTTTPIAACWVIVLSATAIGWTQWLDVRDDARRLNVASPSVASVFRVVGVSAGLALATLFMLSALYGGAGKAFKAFLRGIGWVIYASGVLFVKLLELLKINFTQNGVQMGPDARPQEENINDVDYDITNFTGSMVFTLGIVLIILITIVIMIIVKLAIRKEHHRDYDAGVTTTNLLATGLIFKQIRDWWSGTKDSYRTINLDKTPTSVRETMLYLQTLGKRSGIPRLNFETAADFDAKLARRWPAVETELQKLRQCYERTRYGETPADVAEAVSQWQRIYQHRLAQPGSL